MEKKSLYQFIKLGMNLEYLSGISTISILLGTSMVAFPNLTANLPAGRFRVKAVIEVMRSVIVQLKDLGLEQSLAAAAPLQPMLQEMEQFMGQVPSEAIETITLQDPFADRLVAIARNLQNAVRQEAGSIGVSLDSAARESAD